MEGTDTDNQGQAGKRHLNTMFSATRINRLGRTAYASLTQVCLLPLYHHCKGSTDGTNGDGGLSPMGGMDSETGRSEQN